MIYYPGDYVKVKNDGGMEWYGDLIKIFDNGEITIIPDGGKNPVPVRLDQIMLLERAGWKRVQTEFKAKIEAESKAVPWSKFKKKGESK